LNSSAKRTPGHRHFPHFRFVNSIENMRVSIDAALESGAVCEAAICYTGDILDKAPKYSSSYYVTMAKHWKKSARTSSP